MTRVERRYFLNSLLLGICLTALVAVVDYFGKLEQLERWFYDVRARNCQIFNPPPTEKLIHLDIDDRALDSIGAWPWRRTALAEILDEIRVAGAKAVAMDVIFSEPQKIDYEIERHEDGSETVKRQIDHDANFAASIRRSGNVLLPAALVPSEQTQLSGSQQAIKELMLVDLELSEVQVAEVLKQRGISDNELSDDYLIGRRLAMRERIDGLLGERNYTLAELRRLLLPRADTEAVRMPTIALLEAQYVKSHTARALERFMRERQEGLPPLMNAHVELPPILPLSEATVSSGFVDYLPFSDGVVRAVPLWVDADGKMYPQMGLALACMMLGTDPGRLVLDSDRVVIPLTDGAKEIPVRTISTSNFGTIGLLMDVPWWGGGDWTTMYDHPDHRDKDQHASVMAVWDICEMRRTIERNNANIDKALNALLDYFDSDAGKAYAAAIPPLYDTEIRRPMIEKTLRLLADSQYLEMLEATADRTPDEQLNYDALANAKGTLEESPVRNANLQEQLNRSRVELSERLRGKAVLIGWTATGSADIVPTSLHPRCPGVVVHGAIFNAIMTDNYWRFAPAWVTLAATVAAGLATTLLVGWLAPSRALIAVILLAAGYLALNGFVLFDYGNWVIGIAGPIVAIALVWSGCTIVRLLDEAIQRERIKRRFEHYVDPKLVSYILEDPSRIRLDGEVREMTVVFTDLAGFTTLSERLKERSVELLNEFLSLMVPVIRDMHQGYVNKFLGDGIMFFYGAPYENVRHASNAVATVLDMLRVLEEFNGTLAERGLPTLSLRAGISSGDMVVGDAGSKEAGDYTVLGDCVNFGARLESANKALGTGALLSRRTVELIGDEFLVRPVGLIQVVGKTEGVLTYEVLNRMESATPQQKRLAEISRQIVDTFTGRQFRESLAALAELEREFGPSKFVAFYRELAERYLREPPGDDFDGKVILTEK